MSTRQRPSGMPHQRYRPFQPISLSDRGWPRNVITAAPRWCAVDLRDGNQALIDPMDGARKLRMFQLLSRLGYKEIEVGFPAASQTDFDFVRQLIDDRLIPDDVVISVLTQSRAELIGRTFEAIAGAERAIVHLYNSTNPLQRWVVFNTDRAGVTAIAVEGAELCRKLAARDRPWAVPYLPIDPRDVGRTYEAVIRVNSQSGKGGVAYVMRTDHGLDLPRRLQIEFARVVQACTDTAGGR